MLKKQVEHVDYADTVMWSTIREGPQHEHFETHVAEAYHASSEEEAHPKRAPLTLPRGCKTLLLELFAGAMILSTTVAAMGYPVSQPADLKLDGTDLRDRERQKDIERQIDHDDPYFVTIAFPCELWSTWQAVNCSRSSGYAKELTAKQLEQLPMLAWIAKIAKQRIEKGRVVLLENSWSSQAWNYEKLDDYLC